MTVAGLCLALAIYFEARGEPLEGQQAVAQVILNRVGLPYFPNTVCGVVFQDDQFSFPRRIPVHQKSWESSKKVAQQVLEGRTPNIVQCSDHYAKLGIEKVWMSDMKIIAVIGNHIFYQSKRSQKSCK